MWGLDAGTFVACYGAESLSYFVMDQVVFDSSGGMMQVKGWSRGPDWYCVGLKLCLMRAAHHRSDVREAVLVRSVQGSLRDVAAASVSEVVEPTVERRTKLV